MPTVRRRRLRRYRAASPHKRPAGSTDPRDLVDRHTFVVSPDEVDDRLISTLADFGPNRRLRPRLGEAITQAIKMARERAKRKNYRAVGVYECRPFSAKERDTPAQFRYGDGGCAIVGYTTTDENDHIVFTNY